MLAKADLDDHDAVEMARLVRAGEVTGSEVVEACLRRIEEVEPRLGAFVHVDGDAALQAARDREGRPLAGVPFAVKDVAGYPGMRWAMGSRMLDGNVAAEHSPYSEALDLAGLVTVGKTATSEFALLGSTESLLEGATVNPWRQGVSAAGSSGGAAAAVAAGVLPVAHASDGGGSVRVPASVCGLFGFKPSNGRTQPAVPPGGGFSDLVVDHCVSRSVRDSAALLRATERTGDDATYEPVGAVTEPQNGCLRIVTWHATLTGEQPDADVASALDDTAALCAELGHRVLEVSPPAVDGGAVSEAFFTLAGAAVDQVAAMMAPVLGRQVGADELEPFTLELLDWYRGLPELRRNAAPGTLAREAAAYRSVFDEVDVVLTPTLAVSPWPLGYLAPTVGRAELVARTEQIVGYTPIHNIAGCPAMTVPLGWTADDLPMGSHFAAAPGADALLLRLAYQLEAAQPWWERRPPRQVVAAH